jgi:predicted Zn-dependent protease with MMP-like domain
MLDNVEVVVEDEPTPEQVAANRTRGDTDDGHQPTLFGLYEGVPLVERGQGYSLVLPDKITIFRGPLERAFRSPQALIREVRVTVVHELGHHLGLDEERLEELGWA